MINVEFKSVIELIRAFPDEQTCIDHLEEIRWGDNVISPFEPQSKVYKCKGNRYRCKETSKYFNVRTNTLFENSKVELQKWFLAIWLITSHKKGISSLQLSRDIDVTQKTAWFMLHRIRNCFGISDDEQLGNEVEVDETYVGGKNKNRHFSKKVKASKGRSLKDKAAIVGMVERGGKLIARRVPDVGANTLTSEILRVVKDATIYTDEWFAYRSLSRIYDHHFIRHGDGNFVRGRVHTNTIEGFWSLLKRGIVGIYHFTSRKHVQKHVDEFVFRYNTRRKAETNRFNLMLTYAENRLTYKSLIA